MKNKKIILAGGTGFIGEEMTKYFGKENNIIILTRQVKNEKNNRNDYISLSDTDLKNVRYAWWDGNTVGDWANELNGADLVINLAGKSVNCRYTQKNKNEIFDSRINAIKAIGEGVKNAISLHHFGLMPLQQQFIVMLWTNPRMNTLVNFMMISQSRFANVGKKLFTISKLHKQEKLH